MKLCTEFIFKSFPWASPSGLCLDTLLNPVWFLAPTKNNRTDLWNDLSDPSLPSLIKNVLFSGWPLLGFLVLTLHAFSLPLFQGWSRESFFMSYFSQRQQSWNAGQVQNLSLGLFTLCHFPNDFLLFMSTFKYSKEFIRRPETGVSFGIFFAS